MCIYISYNITYVHLFCVMMSLSPLGATCLLLTLQALTGPSEGQSRPQLSVMVVSSSDLTVIILRCDGGPAGLLPSYHSRVGNVNRTVTLSSGESSKAIQLAITVDARSDGYYYCQVGSFISKEVPLVGELHLMIINDCKKELGTLSP